MAELLRERTALAEDQLLARRIQAGEEDALEALVRAHHPRLARLAGRFFRHGDLIDEVLQETFVRAYRAMARYRGDAPLEHWLTKIAVNVCHDHLRRRRRRPEEPLAEPSREPSGGKSGGEEGSHDPWAREEARIAAEQLLARLAPADRVVLTLLVLEECPVSEVAALTGWSAANVKVRAWRARARLRKLAGPDAGPGLPREVAP